MARHPSIMFNGRFTKHYLFLIWLMSYHSESYYSNSTVWVNLSLMRKKSRIESFSILLLKVLKISAAKDASIDRTEQVPENGGSTLWGLTESTEVVSSHGIEQFLFLCLRKQIHRSLNWNISLMAVIDRMSQWRWIKIIIKYFIEKNPSTCSLNGVLANDYMVETI